MQTQQEQQHIPIPIPMKQKPFTGGAAMARQKAIKKKTGKRIFRPGETAASVLEQEQQAKAKSKDFLPLKMNSLERFFACLLRSRASDFVMTLSSTAKDKTEDVASLQLWHTLCHRVGLIPPTERLRAVYDNHQTHFQARAALVLEEARHAIASSLRQFFVQRNKNNHKNKMHMLLTVSQLESANSYGHVKITLQNQQRSYTSKELYDLRPGGILAIRTNDNSNSNNINNNKDKNTLVLGVIVSSSRDQLESKKCFTILVFRPDDITIQQGNVLTVTVLAQLVTELRCFEALTTPQTRNIAFLHSLLGRPSAVHTRFHETPTDNVVAEQSSAAVTPSPANQHDQEIIALASTYFHLPQLNETQQQAATQFLHSKPSSLTLVQGPPGTGKSTLLLSIICRYLTESVQQVEQFGGDGKRLLVSAPTNKAVSVLATRYLSAIRHGTTCPCNAIVVGDADKLLGDSSNSDNSSPLRSIFLYTWLPDVIVGYTRIRAHFLPKTGNRSQLRNRNDSLSNVCQLAVQLQHRLTNSLPYLSKDILRWTQTIAQSMTALEQTGTPAPTVVDTITKLLNELQQMPNEAVWEQLLLSANVIFCTLAGAGSVVMKKTSRVDDFIVDEAAASTEAELCIPLHLRPARLLAVGDPLQLPATVLSPRAMKLGLATSLHERLMYQCQYPHVMLNLQYRMSASIARFPSHQFYQGRIGNGSNVTGPNYIQGGAQLLDRLPYIFLQINDGMEQQTHSNGSYSNRAEAMQIAELVMQLRQQNSQSSSSSSSATLWCSPDRLRVITFYQAQVILIQRCLEERGLGRSVLVATVDSSQGCEADIVLISFVRTKNAGFLTDDRRLNVALTRARYQLVCVGHGASLGAHRNAPTLQRLLADADERGLVRTPWRTTTTTTHQNNNWTANLDMFYGRDEDENARVLNHASTGPAPKKMRRT